MSASPHSPRRAIPTQPRPPTPALLSHPLRSFHTRKRYGPGFSIDAAKPFAADIGGQSESWSLPLDLSASGALEPLAPLQWKGAEAARHEAAYKLASNADNVVRFAARGCGQPGRKTFQAPLADPYASHSERLMEPVDTCLRRVATALIDGDALDAGSSLKAELEGCGASPQEIRSCLAYLRDRVGVPRDMGQAAAFELRAHLNWAISAVCS